MLKKLPLKSALYLAVGLNIGSLAVIMLLKDWLPPVVPLFYGLPNGESQLVSVYGLLLVPGGLLVITLTNTLMAIYVKDLFFKKSLIVTSAFVSALGAVTIIKIILLVGFF
jgi:hypothetical protein